MQQTFDEPNQRHSAAVIFISQADPGFDATDATRAPVRDAKTVAETDGFADGFKDFLVALRQQAVAFKKPVVYVHGDSHYFRIDKPFLDEQGADWKTSRALKRLATIRRTAPMTFTGSRSWWTPAAVRFLRIRSRSFRATGSRFQHLEK